MLIGVIAMDHKEMLGRSTQSPVAGAVISEFRIGNWLIDTSVSC